MTASWISSIFDEALPAYHTEAAGVTNAKFHQFTGLAAHIYKKILKILDDSNVKYYVFAGTMIGYVRNQKMSQWIDDIDIILLEQEIENFEKYALPKLKAAGFHCPTPANFTGGGFHIVSLWEPKTWHADVLINESSTTRISLAQIDVFYTIVNDDGFLRNPGGWGDYPRHDVPIEWVKPGRQIDFLDRQVTVFQNYEDDIHKEYGDVLNNIIVASHGKVFLNLADTPWDQFSNDYDAYVATAKRLYEVYPPYFPAENEQYIVREDTDMETLFGNIKERRVSHLIFEDTRTCFWAMDLKSTFLHLKITAFAETPHQCARLAHLADFIDDFEVSEQSLAILLAGYLSALECMKPISIRPLA